MHPITASENAHYESGVCQDCQQPHRACECGPDACPACGATADRCDCDVTLPPDED